MKCLFVDHEDSFSYNVINFLRETPVPFDVDHIHYKKTYGMDSFDYDLIVLGPGPFTPDEVLESVQMVKSYIYKVPILGICLGMQIMNVATGGLVVRSKSPEHGSTKKICWSGTAESLGHSVVGSYNSLTNINIGNNWQVIAKDYNDEAQAIFSNKGTANLMGLQFHPESFLTDTSNELKKYIMNMVLTKVSG